VLARYFLQFHVTSVTGYVLDEIRKLGGNLNRLFSPILLFNLKKQKFKLPTAKT
jgi:hypothetical protein